VAFQETAVLEGMRIGIDNYFRAVVRELEALMECGWNGLHGMDPWSDEKNVVGEVKIKDLTFCFQYFLSYLNRKLDGAFR